MRKEHAAKFNRGRESVDSKSGRPTEATPLEVTEVKAMVTANRRVKVLEVATACEISLKLYTIPFTIISIKMLKVSARWVPRNLRVQLLYQ